MKKLLVVLLSLPLTAFTIGDSHYFDVKEGNEKYERGNYDEALKLYERARSRKESDVSKYNLGNAYYRKGEYDSSAENFSAMLGSKNAALAKQGLSNFAASSLMAGFTKAEKNDSEAAIKNLKMAASAYKKILLGNPVDKSAKENMELALNKIKELEKQKQNQKPQDKKEEKENKQQNEQGESDQQNDADKQGEKSGPEEKEQKKQDSADKKQKGKMTPEEVERILEALAQNEEKLQKSLRQKRTRNYEVEKDW